MSLASPGVVWAWPGVVSVWPGAVLCGVAGSSGAVVAGLVLVVGGGVVWVCFGGDCAMAAVAKARTATPARPFRCNFIDPLRSGKSRTPTRASHFGCTPGVRPFTTDGKLR